MKTVIIICFFVFFCTIDVFALGIGVVPDRLFFDGGEKTFHIINPNSEAVDFEIKNGFVDCVPANGKIAANGKAKITCKAAADISRNTHILVETKQKGEKVGVIPAVAIKAEIKGEKPVDQAPEEPVTRDVGQYVAAPLVIERGTDDESKTEDSAANEFSIMKDMKPELVSVVVLTAAILAVLACGEFKKKENNDANKEKKKEKSENIEDSAASPDL